MKEEILEITILHYDPVSKNLICKNGYYDGYLPCGNHNPKFFDLGYYYQPYVNSVLICDVEKNLSNRNAYFTDGDQREI